jgi:sporulation protein YlmC with PRC-barrel domain
MSYVTPGSKKPQMSSHSHSPGATVLSASSLEGNEIVNLQEETLGSVKEIMLDTGTGRVAYVVLSSGGLLGIGDRLFAIPWSALSLDTENKRFVLDADAERIKNAPGFDKDNWPDMADRSWGDTVHTYYGMSADYSRN